MIDTGDLRKGLTIELDGTLYNIVGIPGLPSAAVPAAV